VIFFIGGTVGLLRFPDVHSRLHALTKADNLGLGLISMGLVVQADMLAGAESGGDLAARHAGRGDRVSADRQNRHERGDKRLARVSDDAGPRP
jgi:hypothetical protein